MMSVNDFRYLIFFDDGYAQYSRSDDIHKVLDQSKLIQFFKWIFFSEECMYNKIKRVPVIK